MIWALEDMGYVPEETWNIWSRPGFAGTDYNDGDEVEERIQSILDRAQDLSVLSTGLRSHCTDWPSLYHLSSSRANILRPFEPHLRDASVLEIGAGCGAITRYLGECGANVLALEGSRRRAAIARSRCCGLENVTVVADLFEQWECPWQFDFITLIGVLEYATVFGRGASPVEEMLRHAAKRLKPGGHLIVAIENKLGLKYFAGALEDHTGITMYGLEGCYQPQQPRTYGRYELSSMLHNAGFRSVEFLAPFPDYKFPSAIVTERGFSEGQFDAAAFAWQSVCRDPQLPRLLCFAPALVWPAVIENRLGLDLANSFLIVCTMSEKSVFRTESLAWQYATERKKAFCKSTHFVMSDDGSIQVERNWLAPGDTHENGLIQMSLPHSECYTRGSLLSYDLLRIVSRTGWQMNEVGAFLRRYVGILSGYGFGMKITNEPEDLDIELPGRCYDMIPRNIMITPKGRAINIDLEWESREVISLGYLLFRTLLDLLETAPRFGICSHEFERTLTGFIASAVRAAGWSMSRKNILRYMKFDSTIQEDICGMPVIVEGIEAEINRRLTGCQTLYDAIQLRDAQLADRDAQLANRDAQLADRDVQLADRDAQLADRDAIIYGFALRVSALEASLSWRITSPLRRLLRLLKVPGKLLVDIFRYWRCHGLAGTLKHACQTLFYSYSNKLLQRVLLREATARERPPDAVGYSVSSSMAITETVERRNSFSQDMNARSPLCVADPQEWPEIDMGVVTYNSSRWVPQFVDSLLEIDYPRERIFVRFVDNASNDDTFTLLTNACTQLQGAGFRVDLHRQANKGFGAGHNVAIKAGTAPFCLVTNIDLKFEPNCLRVVTAAAVADTDAAAWEFRQKPFEHPKFYDPVTGITHWNSHACVLLRRTALEQVALYDEALFMYGEDVELSYRLRRAGYLLRYCPAAVVWHYTYEDTTTVKPMQYIGSAVANLYIRLIYGSIGDALRVLPMAVSFLLAPEPYAGARRQAVKGIGKVVRMLPRAVWRRKRTKHVFPVYGWGYDHVREGAFTEQLPLPDHPPQVSVITRTYRGREHYLRQALFSVAHQTWPNVEHIVVEDGGATMASIIEEMQDRTNCKIRYIPCEKIGRSAVGNVGLGAAEGRWCLFLDDDDLLFADHIELLATKLQAATHAVASYSLAWEVRTESCISEKCGYLEKSHAVNPMHHQPFDFQILCKHNYLPIQAVLFDRTLYMQRGGFCEDMEYLEDWLLWVTYAYGNGFLYIDKVTSLFRIPATADESAQRQAILHAAYEEARSRIGRMTSSQR